MSTGSHLVQESSTIKTTQYKDYSAIRTTYFQSQTVKLNAIRSSYYDKLPIKTIVLSIQRVIYKIQ